MRREAVEKPHTQRRVFNIHAIEQFVNDPYIIWPNGHAHTIHRPAPPRDASALLFIEHCYGFCQSFTRSLFCWFILYLIFRLDIRRCWLPNQFANAILLIVFNIRYTNLLSLYCQNASYNPSKVFEILTKCELYICIL